MEILSCYNQASCYPDAFSLVQYVKWANLTDLDAFWTDAKVKRMFKNHIYAMTSRINVYNGAAFSISYNHTVLPGSFDLCMCAWLPA